MIPELEPSEVRTKPPVNGWGLTLMMTGLVLAVIAALIFSGIRLTS